MTYRPQKSFYPWTVLIVTVLCFFGCADSKVANRDSRGVSIVCFGDSITRGFGAGSGEDYPSLLREMVDIPVINSGVPGETSADALRRIDKSVLRHDPKIVIVQFGGNDFLKKIPQEETLKNIEQILVRIQHRGAMVVLVSVKTGFFFDSYSKAYRKIARENGAVLIPNILRGIIDNPELKYDKIHPNAKGYEIIADRIYKKIEPLLEN